jgi:hypothetical protein
MNEFLLQFTFITKVRIRNKTYTTKQNCSLFAIYLRGRKQWCLKCTLMKEQINFFKSNQTNQKIKKYQKKYFAKLW